MNDRFASLGYRVALTEEEGVWVATARRLDTDDRFGAGDTDASRAAAREALVRVDDLRRELDAVREQKPWPH